MSNINIELTPELEGIISKNVESGLYKDSGEFIRDLIRKNDLYKDILYQLKLQKLKEMLAPGIKDLAEGNYSHITYEDLMKELDARDGNA